MTILQNFLLSNGYETKVIYWNIILHDILSEFYNRKKINDYERAELALFNIILATETCDKDVIENYKIMFMSLHPNISYLNLNSDKYIKHLINKLDNRIDETLESLNISQYKLIGMPMKLYQWIPAIVIAKKIKQKYPKINIAIGGISTSSVAKSFLENFDIFDFAIWGEGEQALLQLAQKIDLDEKFDSIPHLAFRRKNEIIINKLKLEFTDLNTMIKPIYDDFVQQIDKINKDRKSVQVLIEGGRGCHWHKCKFCFLNEGYLFRTKQPENIINEIIYLIKNYGFRIFNFTDNDVVGNNLVRFNELLDGLIEIKKQYPDFEIQLAEIITKGITEKEIRKMALSGFTNIQIGYESPSNSLLHKINKMNTFASNLLVMKWCKIYNISISGLNIIKSLIEENKKDINEAIRNLSFERFIIRKNGIRHQYTTLAVSENSRYYKQLKDTNKIKNYKQLQEEYTPSNLIDEKDKIRIFSYTKNSEDESWKYYYEAENYLLKNPHTYKMIRNGDYIYYNELCNGIRIKVLTFKVDSIHWKILCEANERIVSLKSLQKFGKVEILIKCINELFNEKLIYKNDDYSELCSVINTNFIS